MTITSGRLRAACALYVRPASTAVAILDTGTRRGLVDSAYNERRSQCEAGAAFFGVAALRDVGFDQFSQRADQLEDLTRRRVRHVVSENDRTEAAAAAMAAGDSAALGKLMDASHLSLRDDFEVSSPALDTMVRLAQKEPGCLGARMTGAGFGGCAVALVEAGAAEAFAQRVGHAYGEATGNGPEIYLCRAAAGAEVL